MSKPVLAAEMKVNFIYTYSVDMDREQEGFFVVTPPEVKNVNTFIILIALAVCTDLAK